jgi:hypothetical protein
LNGGKTALFFERDEGGLIIVNLTMGEIEEEPKKEVSHA